MIYKEIKEKSTCDLESLRDELELKLVDIRHQVEKAKSQAAANSKYVDIDWFHKATYALKKSGQTHQYVIRELAKRRKLEKDARMKSVERCFIEVVRKRLSVDEFQDCWNEAKEESDT